MKKSTAIILSTACLALSACSADYGSIADSYLPTSDERRAADEDGAPAALPPDGAPAGTPLPPAPSGDTKAPPGATPPPAAATPPPAAPPNANNQPPAAELVLPAECAATMENEPNNQNPDALPPRICGYAAGGDTDRFAFDVRDSNAFVLQLDAPSAAPWAEVRGTCIPERRLSVGERMRLVPNKSCTVHVNVFSNTPAAYVLRRDK